MNHLNVWFKRCITFGVIILLAFALSYIGLLSRPTELFASIWFTNAFFIAYFIWLNDKKKILYLSVPVFLGLCGADLFVTESLLIIVHLAITNLISIVVSSLLVIKAQQNIKSIAGLSRFFISLLIGAGASAFYATLFVHGFSSEQFSRSDMLFWLYWFIGELFNNSLLTLFFYILLQFCSGRLSCDSRYLSKIPLLILILSLVLSVQFMGLGSIAFVVPAIIWCALIYPFEIVVILIVASFAVQYFFGLAFIQTFPHDGKLFFRIDQRISLQIGTILSMYVPMLINILITDKKSLITQLEYHAQIDYLTSIYNRRGFLNQLGVQQHYHYCALMLIDIDHFKMINDQHGHIEGDRILQFLANRILLHMQKQEVVSRYGGEEFAIFIHHVDSQQQAFDIAEQLRQDIAAQGYVTADFLRIPISVSIGVKCVENFYIHDFEPLFKCADDALYQAKNNGRNQVVVSA